MTDAAFKKRIWDHYRENGRDMPWRKTEDPYRIWVSEVMLQQTQVSRVVPKYAEFVKRFPSFKALAAARLSEVMSAWKGLGYNRRALNLKRAAELLVREYGGKVPRDPKTLATLPGIGPNTAGSILAFAFNKPVPFIETNVRSVFIHFFFLDKADISDKDILPLVGRTLDRENPREWYYALMDYGAMLKKTANPNLRSRHYARQSPFRGSRREMRSKALAYVLAHPRSTAAAVARGAGLARGDAEDVLSELAREGMAESERGRYFIE